MIIGGFYPTGLFYFTLSLHGILDPDPVSGYKRAGFGAISIIMIDLDLGLGLSLSL